MLIKELPKKISNKTFTDVKEFLVFIYSEQIVTEFGELSDEEVSDDMLYELKEAKKIDRKYFVNI